MEQGKGNGEMKERIFSGALEPLRREIKCFMDQYGTAGWQIILNGEEDADSYLRSEVVCELFDKMTRISELIAYLDREVSREGSLKTGADGSISLNDTELKPGQEVEVYVYDPLLQKMIWTRVKVSAGKNQRLIGVDRRLKIDGLRARIR